LNKEIPNNPQLMKEYNAIEQTTKANGSWMKNSDGSTFQGTPEQFVQGQSENFKKAFPQISVIWMPVSAGEEQVLLIQAEDLR
jgi:hypothetical protein